MPKDAEARWTDEESADVASLDSAQLWTARCLAKIGSESARRRASSSGRPTREPWKVSLDYVSKCFAVRQEVGNQSFTHRERYLVVDHTTLCVPQLDAVAGSAVGTVDISLHTLGQRKPECAHRTDTRDVHAPCDEI